MTSNPIQTDARTTGFAVFHLAEKQLSWFSVSPRKIQRHILPGAISGSSIAKPQGIVARRAGTKLFLLLAWNAAEQSALYLYSR